MKEWIDKRTILYNYDEAELLTANPKIEILNNKFLVFSRGGYYFSLYDISLAKDTINSSSPWHDWKAQQLNEANSNKDDENKYKKWVKENLNDRIKTYIEMNQ